MFGKKTENGEPDIKLLSIIASGDTLKIGLVKSILNDAGIPFITKNENIQNLFGFGNIGGMVNPLSGPIEVLVREEDYEIARTLIENIDK